jgi:hypothetical protein
MHDLDNQKYVSVTPPAAIIDNAAATTAIIDTLGFRRLRFLVFFGAMDIAVAVMKLTESEDSGMSGAVDVSGGDFSVSPATLPSATDDNHFFAVDVKLTGKRKRYMDLSLTLGDGSAGSYVTVIAILAEPEVYLASAADRGLTQHLRV